MPDNVIQSIDIATENFNKLNSNILPINYRDTNISMKLVKIIHSYIKIVNKGIWHKNKLILRGIKFNECIIFSDIFPRHKRKF